MSAVFESTIVVAGTDCIACGRDVWSIRLMGLTDYLTDETFAIHCCNHCMLMVTQPLPPTAQIGRYYPRQYRGNRHSFTGRMRNTLRRKAIEARFGENFRGRLLDVGCGDGSFALEMKSRGWDVSATEIDAPTIARLKDADVDARVSTEVEKGGFDRPFDAITCWHVLEHVEHPVQITEWMHRQLADDGIFQATVPNMDCLQAKVFAKHWVHLDVPRHRQHFAPQTLRAMLEEAGFKIERQTNFAIEYDWFGVIQSALNLVCSRPNVLFDKLTHAPVDESRKISGLDALLSYTVGPMLAAVSLPLISLAALLGDGATLTMTCRKR